MAHPPQVTLTFSVSFEREVINEQGDTCLVGIVRTDRGNEVFRKTIWHTDPVEQIDLDFAEALGQILDDGMRG